MQVTLETFQLVSYRNSEMCEREQAGPNSSSMEKDLVVYIWKANCHLLESKFTAFLLLSLKTLSKLISTRMRIKFRLFWLDQNSLIITYLQGTVLK